MLNKIIATAFFVGAAGYAVTLYNFVTGGPVSDFSIGSGLFFAIGLGVLLGIGVLTDND